MQGAGIEAHRDVPVRVLRMPVRRLESQNHRLPRSGKPSDSLRASGAFDRGRLLPPIEIRDLLLDLFDHSPAGIGALYGLAPLPRLDRYDSLERGLHSTLIVLID